MSRVVLTIAGSSTSCSCADGRQCGFLIRRSWLGFLGRWICYLVPSKEKPYTVLGEDACHYPLRCTRCLDSEEGRPR